MNRTEQLGSITILAERALELLDTLAVDPAHGCRIRCAVDAARLVADGSDHLPGVLGSPEFSRFLDALDVLARDVAQPCEATHFFDEDEDLHQVEITSGPISAALRGLSSELQDLAIGSGLKALPALPVHDTRDLLSLKRAEVAAATKATVRAMVQLERVVDSLRDEPVLSQQVWSILLHAAFAVTLLSDAAAVERRSITHLTGICATAMFKAQEHFPGALPEDFCIAFDTLSSALELIVDCMHAATARQAEGRVYTTLRFITAGRVLLDDDGIETALRKAQFDENSMQRLRSAANLLRAEWAGAA